MTTHSPYLINYLTLSVKAYYVYQSHYSATDNEKILNIVPLDSLLKHEELAIYELDQYGSVSILENYKGIPSDENRLNNELGEFNDLYSELLTIARNKN